MKYMTTLEHDDFVLLLDALHKAQEQGVITWKATDMICEHTHLED